MSQSVAATQYLRFDGAIGEQRDEAGLAELRRAAHALRVQERTSVRRRDRRCWLRLQYAVSLTSVAEATLHEALFGPRLSLEEWADLPEDVPGEFVDGRLVEEEVPDYLHEVLVAWLARVIGNWGDTRDVIVGGSDAKFGVSPTRGRKPDLSVFLGGRRPPARGLVRVPPDIAVEVVSPSPRDARRDREEKMSEYSSFGIRAYWLVDPERRTFEIHQLSEAGSYTLWCEQSSGILRAIPACPELEIDLDQMWSKADALAPHL